MKKMLAFGAIVLAMMAGLLTACAGEKLAQEEIEQIVADVLAANAEVDTCKFDMEMLTTIEIDGGSEPGEATMVAGGTGIIDNASKEMYMTINMIIDVPEQGEQNMLMENYFVDGWMYAKMSMPQMGEQWMKMKMPEEMWGTENKIAQNVELLNMPPSLVVVGRRERHPNEVGDERGNSDPYGPSERRRARCEGDEHQADAADRKTEGEQFSNVSHVWCLLAGEPVVDGVGVADLGRASTAPAAVTATTVRRSSWLMRLSLRV